MITINDWQKRSDLARVVRTAFPQYRRKKINVHVASCVTLHDLNWSGGTRSEYHAVRLADGTCGNGAALNMPAPWNNRAEGATVDIPQGCAVIRGGFFCGKESIVALYVNAADVTPQLTESFDG